MSTQVLNPASDYSIGSGVSKTGFSGSVASGLSDSSDSTYVSFNSSAGGGVGSASSVSMTLAATFGRGINFCGDDHAARKG